MREFLALYFQVSTLAWLLSIAWCSAGGSVRLSFCLCITQEKWRVREAARHCALALGLLYPNRRHLCTQEHLFKLFLGLVEPGMTCPVLLLGHLHDLLEGSIVLACVTAQKDIQTGQGLLLLLLLLSSLSCLGVQVG